MVTHSSILAWRIPMDRGAWGLQSLGSQSQTGLKQLTTHAQGDALLKIHCILPVVIQSLNHVQLCAAMDCSPPGSSVHGIFPGKWENGWVAISFSSVHACIVAVQHTFIFISLYLSILVGDSYYHRSVILSLEMRGDFLKLQVIYITSHDSLSIGQGQRTGINFVEMLCE